MGLYLIAITRRANPVGEVSHLAKGAIFSTRDPRGPRPSDIGALDSQCLAESIANENPSADFTPLPITVPRLDNRKLSSVISPDGKPSEPRDDASRETSKSRCHSGNPIGINRNRRLHYLLSR